MRRAERCPLAPVPKMGPHPVVTTAVQAQLDRSEAQMRDAGVVAILRAKNADVAIQRGIELVSMGCKAIEVTWDSAEKERILPALVAAVGDRCLVGVGTVEHVSQVELCAKLGARFALSPINPPGMIEACHSRGVLAVPAAFSPQEIHDAWAQVRAQLAAAVAAAAVAAVFCRCGCCCCCCGGGPLTPALRAPGRARHQGLPRAALEPGVAQGGARHRQLRPDRAVPVGGHYAGELRGVARGGGGARGHGQQPRGQGHWCAAAATLPCFGRCPRLHSTLTATPPLSPLPPPPPLAGVPPGQQHANAMAEAKRKWAQGGKAAAAKVFADVDAHLQKAGRAKL